jgi:hypothetical protein
MPCNKATPQTHFCHTVKAVASMSVRSATVPADAGSGSAICFVLAMESESAVWHMLCP